VVPVTRAGIAPRVARLTVFLAAVAAGAFIAAAGRDLAPVRSPLADLGAGLAELAAVSTRPAGAPRVLELNGARLHLATATRPEPLAAVLGDAESACVGEEGGRVREDDGGRGFVACAALLTAEELAAIEAPGGAEIALGQPGFRYVFAQAGERTLVVRLWSDRPLDLERMFPATGDSPGADVAGMPRPPGARRFLSARELGAPQALTVYVDAGAEPAELERWYRTQLGEQGWDPLDRDGAASSGDQVLIARRADELAALVFAGDSDRSVAILSSL
jgi:hypothetical protein